MLVMMNTGTNGIVYSDPQALRGTKWIEKYASATGILKDQRIVKVRQMMFGYTGLRTDLQ